MNKADRMRKKREREQIKRLEWVIDEFKKFKDPIRATTVPMKIG